MQITPAYPPDISGVGDYAALLSRSFGASGHDLDTVVPGSAERTGKRVVAVDREAEPLARTLAEADNVLLHFSGYGYARRGLCHWLVDGLARWKAGGKDRRLVTMFHEVYATGPIWRSSFWTAGPQRRIARDLARLSDAGFVSSLGGYEQLHSLCPELPLEVSEVFSNIGELETPLPFSQRRPEGIVFGGAARRRQVYQALHRSGDHARAALHAQGVRRLLDIGPPMTPAPSIEGLEVEICGPLPATDVSALLAERRIGLIHYKRSTITKSGIAAAYFSHGLLVVNTGEYDAYSVDMQEGVHLLDLNRLLEASLDAEAVSQAGWARYQPHRLDVTSTRLARALGMSSARNTSDA